MEERLNKVCGEMEEQDVDYLLLGPSPALYYLTGIKTVPDERLQLAVVGRDGEIKLIFPEMYRDQINMTDFTGQLSCWGDDQAPAGLVAEALDLKQDSILAVDDLLRFLHFQMIKDLFKGNKLVLASEIMKNARMYKDKKEVKYLREAAVIADKVMNEMKDYLKPGLTEKEIAFQIEFSLKKYGGDGLSFNPIVAAGKNGALPHHNTGQYKVQKGDFVTMDFGCSYQGYCSDITRTYCVGEPDQEMKKVYETVKAAQEEAVAAVKPGLSCADIDRAARKVIEDAGYGKYFVHRTGHGIGLEVHEPPYIVEGNETLLQPGMAFSIEPGIYLPDKFGVRIEDIVVVTSDGCKLLNKVEKKLITV